MRIRLVCRCLALLVSIALACLILTAAIFRPAMRSAQPRLEQFKDGFAQRGGQAWFYCEQLADDIQTRVASSFSKLRNTLLPSAVNQLPPAPTATDSIQLSDQAPQPPAADS